MNISIFPVLMNDYIFDWITNSNNCTSVPTEFGIPAEELGLETLETNTSNMPAGLVAA